MVKTSSAQVLALVPARGGSKSIPRKNIRPLAGHPLIAYSIAAALAARHVARVIVSTDDPEIAAVARAYGAEVPFLRPAALAQDDTPDLPVFQHALGFLQAREAYAPEIVVQLRPTSPLRPEGLVDRAVDLLLADPSADCVRGVCSPSQNPYKMWRPSDDGAVVPLMAFDGGREPYNMPRQVLPAVLWQTGHVDVIRGRTIVEKASVTGDRVLPVMVDRLYSVDIDTEVDWARAETLLAEGRLQTVSMPPDGARRARAAMIPSSVSLLVLDFDGVLTDDRVWTDQDGRESVACSRSDGLGIERLRRAGVEVVVLSRESNPVVAARCRKLGIECRQGVQDKGPALRALMADRHTLMSGVIYVGNDITDLPCFAAVGYGVAVADAHPAVREKADLVLSTRGGRGAVRELCDLILDRLAHVPHSGPEGARIDGGRRV